MVDFGRIRSRRLPVPGVSSKLPPQSQLLPGSPLSSPPAPFRWVDGSSCTSRSLRKLHAARRGTSSPRRIDVPPTNYSHRGAVGNSTGWYINRHLRTLLRWWRCFAIYTATYKLNLNLSHIPSRFSFSIKKSNVISCYLSRRWISTVSILISVSPSRYILQ